MKLETPYYSQFADVHDSFWMIRACGGICLKIVAEYHLPVDDPNREGAEVPDILSLCNEAKERGGYNMQNGWVHDYIVMKAKELGLQAYRKEGITNIDEIISFLDSGNPVIVSVEKRVLEQTRFHMIVIVGYEQIETSQIHTDPSDNTSETASELSPTSHLPPSAYLYYHESESTDKEKGQYHKCSKEVFLEYFRGKAIFISK